MNQHEQPQVQCPFYRQDDHRSRILCEGVIPDTTLAQTFRHRKDYQKQLEVFCCQHYQKCEVYRMVMEKYEE